MLVSYIKAEIAIPIIMAITIAFAASCQTFHAVHVHWQQHPKSDIQSY